MIENNKVVNVDLDVYNSYGNIFRVDDEELIFTPHGIHKILNKTFVQFAPAAIYKYKDCFYWIHSADIAAVDITINCSSLSKSLMGSIENSK